MLLKVLCLVSVLSTGVWSAFETGPNYFAQLYATGPNPRGLFLDESGDVLFVGVSARGVFALRETENGDGSVSVDHKQIVSGSPFNIVLNHAVTHHNGYLYASSNSGVYRWPYVAGSREEITSDPETVVEDIPTGGHDTRTLVFDSESRLYVSVGSRNNVDPNSDRARIIRFDLNSLPNAYSDAEVIAKTPRVLEPSAIQRRFCISGLC
jgi:glucose/arabinose dehydrogenase